MPARLILHLPAKLAEGALPGFYRKICAGAEAAGLRVDIRIRDKNALQSLGETDDFHLVHNGSVRHANALNTGIAYIAPFWYADPVGIYGDSSLTQAPFDPTAIDPEAARRFHDQLVARLVLPRKSRYPQPDTRDALPEGAIAIFLQGTSEPVERARHMSSTEMVETVLADTGGRHVIVKPHPRNRTLDMFEALARVQHRPGVTVTDGNIHDILDCAAVTVSIGSAVALEGMMHATPAVLFGRSDLRHCAETVMRPADWPAARDKALSCTYPFAAFLHWFLRDRMLNAGRDDLLAQLCDRLRERGFDPARLAAV